MKRIITTIGSLMLSASVNAKTGVFVPQMAHCDVLVEQFLSTYDIPGATFAMSKDGKLIYSRGFGVANLAQDEAINPHHLLRIASISKPITSIAIMKLVELGQVNLSDKIFGAYGIFSGNSYFATTNSTDPRLNDITVQHLLEHSAGWDRNAPCIEGESTPYPWSYSHCDPIAFPLHVTQTLGEPEPVTERAMVKFLMEKGLNFDPGSQFVYSNIGYLLLGLVVEKITGLSYEQFVKSVILEPVGVKDVHLAKNLLQDKQEREVEYFGNGFTAPDAYGTGNYVPLEYGGWSVEAMDAHGGWIATARDLVRLLGAVDKFTTSPDILSPGSLAAMTTPGVVNYYAKGWSINSANNWWHKGSLDGTAAIWVRANAGFNWAVLLNKRRADSQANAFWNALDALPWNCLTQTASFPTHDLFDVPKISSSGLSITSAGQTSLSISWQPGDADKYLLVVRRGAPVSSFPVDGENYIASSRFGDGEQLLNEQYVVYNGVAASTTVYGLLEGETYNFKLFDYNQNNTSGNHAIYLAAEYQQLSAQVMPVLMCNGKGVTVNLNNDELPTSGHDVILGTSAADAINALGGDDTICGLGGDDIINAGRGNDWVDAGPGNDTVEGGSGSDEIHGDSGVDILNGGPDADAVYGEADGDFIKGNSGNDYLDGGFGIDQILGGSGNDEIHTGSGGNLGTGLLVNGGAGNDIITGGRGMDSLRGETGNDIIYGGDARDELYGGGGNDVIYGQNGNDLIKGNGSKDTLYGGDGNDDLDGGDSDDVMYGSNGNDVMFGSTGNDRIFGGAGNDVVSGGGGSDILYGNRGDDQLYGGGSNDTLNGGSDTDTCNGEGGSDSATSCESQINVP